MISIHMMEISTYFINVADAPIFISFPHFYLAGKELQESLDGLKPDPEKHDMYLDVHPVSSFIIILIHFCVKRTKTLNN